MKIPKRFLVTPHDTVSAETAAIIWDNNPDGSVCNVRVVEHPIRRGLNYHGSGGACYGDWLNPAAALEGSVGACSLTPEGTFGVLCHAGFADTQELHNAIVQFARISSCHWAQAMLYAFGEAEEMKIRREAINRRNVVQENSHAI